MPTSVTTYAFAPGGDLTIDQMEGSITIAAWDEPRVELTAEAAGADPVDEWLEVIESPGRLSVRVTNRRSGWFGVFTGRRIDLKLMVPVGTRCRVEAGSGAVAVSGTRAFVTAATGSGNVALTGVHGAEVEAGSGDVRVQTAEGDLDIETGSGNVRVEQVRGQVEVEVGSGDVQLRQVVGAVRVETGSGDLSLEAVAGNVALETGSGGATIRDVTGGMLSAETGGGTVRGSGLAVGGLEVESGSGAIELELLSLRPGGSYRVTTGSGGATVALPPTANAVLDLRSDSGRINWDGLNLKVIDRDDDEVRAQLGDGGARVYIESGSGGIRLRPAAGGSAAAAPATPAEQLRQAVSQDSALVNHEAMQKVLSMVEQGKLSPEEAEELLRALDQEDSAS